MNSISAQLWVVGICVALALGYTVRSALVKLKRVNAGGAACGGCSGDACGSSGCVPKNAIADKLDPKSEPVRWYPPVGRAGTGKDQP